MAENQTKPTKASVAEFIVKIADETKRADAKALVKLMRDVTGEKPVMWGPAIVGFGTYHYKYESGREGDMPLTAFAPRASGNVVYLNFGVGMAKRDFPALGKHKLSGGCLHIKRLADVDMAVLSAIVAESAGAARSRAKAKAKALAKR